MVWINLFIALTNIQYSPNKIAQKLLRMIISITILGTLDSSGNWNGKKSSIDNESDFASGMMGWVVDGMFVIYIYSCKILSYFYY